MFPVITVSGSAYARGHQYGEQSRERVHRSVDAYAQVFHYYAGWDWQRSTDEAQRFLPPISSFAPDLVDELSGIADGAGVELVDVLAINVRTEILYAARVRNAVALPLPSECSVFASVAPGGHVIAGQNWDWIPFARDTVVVLQAVPDDGPAYVTAVEAGLLAKFGANSSGLAVMTNALACTEDVGAAAVPYHVMLRALLQCHTTDEAVQRLESVERASSANYLLVDESGSAVNVEARPGDERMLHRMRPDARQVLLHTNHFESPDFDSVDYAELVPSTSRTRLGRAVEIVSDADDAGSMDVYAALLTDHVNGSDRVCRHPDPDVPGLEQTMTVSSVLVDLTDRRIQLSEGPPCEQGYEKFPSTAIWN